MKRLKRGQNEKWKKGQSCASNPTSNKFREKSKSNYFQKLEGESSLTMAALALHTATVSGSGENVLTINQEDDQSVGKSLNTFATKFTTYTIPAFERFFKNFTVESELHTIMLAAHATAQQYLQDNNIPETATSYLCVFMENLEEVKDEEKHVAAVLSLMARAIRKVSPDVLKAKYAEFEKLLFEIFELHGESQETSIISNVIGCLSVILQIQDISYWDYPFAKNLLQKILLYSTHENPKIRKAAQYNISAILKGSSFQSESTDNENEEESFDEDTNHFIPDAMVDHPAAKHVGDFIVHNLKISANNKNGKATLFLLSFLQQVIYMLPLSTLKKCSSSLLGIMHIGDPIVNYRALKVLQVLFKHKGPTGLDIDVNIALVNALMQKSSASSASTQSLQLIPQINNEPHCSTWIRVVTDGIICLKHFDSKKPVSYFSSWVQQLVIFWKSEHKSVHENINYVIKNLLDEAILPFLDDETAQTDFGLNCIAAFKMVEEALSFQYESAWPSVYRTLITFYKTLGKYFPSEMISCLKKLDTMSENILDDKIRNLLENVIGAAISALGPQIVFQTIPIEIIGNIENDKRKLRMLPLYRRYAKNSSLSYFVKKFMPLANKCAVMIDRKFLDPYQKAERQIWALLPTFATGATDVDLVLDSDIGTSTVNCKEKFARLISNYIVNRDDLRIDLLAALRCMINASKDQPRSILGNRFSKNYIPVLLNLYLQIPSNKAKASNTEPTIDPGHRLAVLNTIETYLQIIPSSNVVELKNLAMNKFENSEDNPFKQKNLLHIIKCFVPYLPGSSLLEIMNKIKGSLFSNSTLQKATYRIIESILSAEVDVTKAFVNENMNVILKLWIDAQSSTVSNAKGARLKCVLLILQHLPETMGEEGRATLFQLIFKEAIMCLGNTNNAEAIKKATAVLVEIGKTAQRILKLTNKETFEYCMTLVPKLDSVSSLTPNVILTLIILFYKYKESVPIEILQSTIEEITQLLMCDKSDIIKSCLGFIRVLFVLYPPVILSLMVDSVVTSIVGINLEIRSKFRLKIGDILISFCRRFGPIRIKSLTQEDVIMRKMITNRIKIENRKKRQKKTEEQDDEEEKEAGISPLDNILEELDNDLENDGKKGGPKTKSILKNNKRNEQNDKDSSQRVKTKKSKSITFVDELNTDEEVNTDEDTYGVKFDKKTNKIIIRKNYVQESNKDDDDNFMAFEELKDVLPKEKTSTFPSSKAGSKRKRNDSENSDPQLPPNAKSVKIKYDYGSEFKAKKAGGDSMKKGGVAPYAYVKFSREKLNKRKKAKYAGQYKDVVKGAAKKGGKKKHKK